MVAGEDMRKLLNLHSVDVTVVVNVHTVFFLRLVLTDSNSKSCHHSYSAAFGNCVIAFKLFTSQLQR